MKRARELSGAFHRTFRAHVVYLCKAEQVFAIDKFACNKGTGDRRYGWSAGRTPVELVCSMKRSAHTGIEILQRVWLSAIYDWRSWSTGMPKSRSW